MLIYCSNEIFTFRGYLAGCELKIGFYSGGIGGFSVRVANESKLFWSSHVWKWAKAKASAREEREKGELYPGVGLHLPLGCESIMQATFWYIFMCAIVCIMYGMDADTYTTNNASGNRIAPNREKKEPAKCELRYKMV